MNLEFNLRLEQTQKLIMTQELCQAIKILQLSAVELSHYVNQVLTENPLIEIMDALPVAEAQDKKKQEIEWEDYLQNLSGPRNGTEQSVSSEERQEFALENLMTKGRSLEEYLRSQLGVLPLDKRQKRIALYLIGNIDSSGYLTVTVEQAQQDLKENRELIEKVLSIIQGFDPPGIAARDLKECLSLQLKQKGIEDPAAYEIVQKHLRQIAAGSLNKVAQALNLPVIKVQELADIIKSLNPKPGASFGEDQEINYIVPDVIVENLDGEFIIHINETNTPLLTINKTYASILKQNTKVDEKTREFVENKLNQAIWLIRSIEQRRSTIYQVTESLIEMQREFFRHGVGHLKPLTLKELADKVGVHESTVSRATSNKYIQTPHGTFEYRYFFSSGLNTAAGDRASSESIKLQIQDLIKNEDQTKPLSDQKIADLLKEQGINIARRTVTKYREVLGILNAVQRKRY